MSEITYRFPSGATINVVPTDNWKTIKEMDWGGCQVSFAHSGEGTSTTDWWQSYRNTVNNTALTKFSNCIIDSAPLIFSANSLQSVDNVKINNLAYCTFSNDTGLTSVTNVTLPNDSRGTFQMDSGLTEFQGSCSGITDGQFTFYNCQSLKELDIDGLDSLTAGTRMFYNCKVLDWDGYDLPELTDGSYMFKACGLTGFVQNLPKLVSGMEMFSTALLKVFSGSIPEATTCQGMFANCSALTSLTIGADKLTNAGSMAYGCKALESISADLPEATTVYGLCSDCSALTSVNVSAPKATNAYMAFGCNTGTSGELKTARLNLSKLSTYSGLFQNQTGLTYVEMVVPQSMSSWTYSNYSIPTSAPCTAYRKATDNGDGTWTLVFSTGATDSGTVTVTGGTGYVNPKAFTNSSGVEVAKTTTLILNTTETAVMLTDADTSISPHADITVTSWTQTITVKNITDSDIVIYSRYVDISSGKTISANSTNTVALGWIRANDGYCYINSITIK